MENIQLDYSDIKDIFKEKLKIDNIVKTVASIFLNERYASKIDYKPYFQRNYVWDDEKATYFIESIMLGTEIPPLVLFQTYDKNEVIDGRQRYETIERFLRDKLVLSEKGLHCLKSLKGRKYSQISDALKENFEDTRIRILQFQVVNEPKLDEGKEDKIKKEIFRRYNSGITPLEKYDIERAAYIDDKLTQQLKFVIENDIQLYNFLRVILVPKRKMKAQKRDQVNIMVTMIRDMITLPRVPIKKYAKASSKAELLHRSYSLIAQESIENEISKFKSVVEILREIYEECKERHLPLRDNKLFYEVLYWAISIILDLKCSIDKNKRNEIYDYISNAENEDIWKGIKDNGIKTAAFIFDATGSHYYSAIINRYTFIANIFEKVFKISADQMLNAFKSVADCSEENEVKEIESYKLNKPLPETLTIEDIVREMNKSRFLIRPPYQRSETKDLQKASYLMESILLGFTIPPIFVYKRKDKIREVVDGQQRLLTILGYLSKTYLDEKGEYVSSDKDKFKLSKLKILTEQNGKTIDTIAESFEEHILEFPLDIIEIDGVQNPAFDPIDLFLRLNTKPYPIKENSFEMWNAYADKEIVLRVKEIAKKYQGTVFRNKDNRMKLEELIISLAYLDYRISNRGYAFSQTVNIYKRNDRISARIMSKDQVTKTLGEVSNTDVESFLKSIESVEYFAKKILAIVKNDTTKIRDLVNHLRKGTNYKSDQNYYFLWALLNNIPLDYIKNNQERLYKEIQNVFAIIQNTPEQVTAIGVVNALEGFKEIMKNEEYKFVVESEEKAIDK